MERVFVGLEMVELSGVTSAIWSMTRDSVDGPVNTSLTVKGRGDSAGLHAIRSAAGRSSLRVVLRHRRRTIVGDKAIVESLFRHGRGPQITDGFGIYIDMGLVRHFPATDDPRAGDDSRRTHLPPFTAAPVAAPCVRCGRSTNTVRVTNTGHKERLDACHMSCEADAARSTP